MPKYNHLTITPADSQKRSLDQYDDLITRASKTYCLSPALIKAVIKVESGFIEDAVSHAGAQGLMQLMPDTAKDLKIVDVFDPGINIFGGTRLLREHISSSPKMEEIEEGLFDSH